MEIRERSYLMDELGDPDAPVGSRLWSLWLANEIRKTFYDNQQTGTRLRYLVDTFKEHTAWQELGFLTWEDFCSRNLHVEPEKVETEVKLRAQGRPSKDEKGNNYNLFDGDRGTSKAYTEARLQRDEPALYERVKQGELSANAAAIEAGWRKPQTRYSLPDDPQAAGRYLAQRVDRAWFDTLIDSYYKAIEG